VSTVAANKQHLPQDLLANLEKALRRGKKLERTLLKIVAQSQPGSDVESLLKSVQHGLKTLKNEAKQAQRSPASETKRVPAQRTSVLKSKSQIEISTKPVRRLRKKEPASADLSLGEQPADA
jgi:phage-related minor tail protein